MVRGISERVADLSFWKEIGKKGAELGPLRKLSASLDEKADSRNELLESRAFALRTGLLAERREQLG